MTYDPVPRDYATFKGYEKFGKSKNNHSSTSKLDASPKKPK